MNVEQLTEKRATVLATARELANNPESDMAQVKSLMAEAENIAARIEAVKALGEMAPVAPKPQQIDEPWKSGTIGKNPLPGTRDEANYKAYAFGQWLRANLGVASANTFRSTAASRVLGQAFGTAPETQSANPTLRVSNAVEYFLPSGLGGLHGGLIATAGERGTTAAGQTSGRGLRLGWSAGRFMVSAAQFTTRNTRSGQDFVDRSLGASWNFGDAKLSLAQRRTAWGRAFQVV